MLEQFKGIIIISYNKCCVVFYLVLLHVNWCCNGHSTASRLLLIVLYSKSSQTIIAA